MKAATLRVCAFFVAPQFQSTPPVKAATWFACGIRQFRPISIHAAREGGDSATPTLARLAGISIHAAREGGDADFGQHIKHVAYFNPRRP